MRFEPETAALYPNAQVSTIEIDGKNYIDVYQNPAIEQNPGW